MEEQNTYCVYGDTTWVTCFPSHPSSLAPTYSHLPGTTLITFSIFTNTTSAIYVPQYKLTWLKTPCLVDRLSSTRIRVQKLQQWTSSSNRGQNTAPTEDNNISPTEDKQLKLARSCSEPCESKQSPNCAQTAQALAMSCESKHLWKKTWNPSHHSVQTSWADRFFWAKTLLWDFLRGFKHLMYLCNNFRPKPFLSFPYCFDYLKNTV